MTPTDDPNGVVPKTAGPATDAGNDAAPDPAASPRPSGRLVANGAGSNLVLERTFRADIADVWASITEPERTARWFADWSGDARPGATIRCRLMFEDDTPETDLTIIACDPPRRLHVHTEDEYGVWNLEATLTEADGRTTLRFAHVDIDPESVSGTGPGWEFYLDLLVFSREGGAEPDFDDYYPAMKQHYLDQLPGATG